MKHGKWVPQIFEHKVKTASQLLFSKYYQPVPKRKRVHLHDYWSFLLRALLSYLPNPSSPAIVWKKGKWKSRIFCHLNAIVVNFKSNLSAWPFINSCHLLMVSTFNGYRREWEKQLWRLLCIPWGNAIPHSGEVQWVLSAPTSYGAK